MGPACIGFATSATEAFVIPFYDVNGCSIWSEEDELLIWQVVAAVLEDAAVPKIIQNAAYELFVLAWTTGIIVRGLVDDTMLKHFELYPELDKSLEFQASIYTSQPYWKLEHKLVEGRYVPFKDGRRATSDEWYIYNGTDCCVTYEVNEVMETMLKPRQREHYRFNVRLLAPMAYMSLRGIRYDEAEAKARLAATREQIYKLQDQINQEAARSESRPELRQFYAALSSFQHGGSLRERGNQMAGGELHLRAKSRAAEVQLQQTELLPLLTTAFCAARRTERVTITETWWQPYRWSDKARKWVKAGKRLREIPHDAHTGATTYNNGNYCASEAEPERALFTRDPENFIWLRPHDKNREISQPVEVKTFEDVRRWCKDACKSECRRAISILSDGCNLSPAQRGELSTLLGIHCNVSSTSQGGDSQWFLYDHCQLPRQYIKEGNKNTNKLASDDLAIVKAWVQSGKSADTRDSRALTFLKLRRALTQTKFLVAQPDEDGRIRSAMNLVATPTCRMAMYGSPTGTSDLNLQTIGKGLRDLFVADEGCYIGQRDLDNSDAYSVAAFCAMLGDPTMLEDVRARLKPAKILARIYEEGAAINQLTREQLKAECAKVDGEGWLYFACKRVLHGTNYGMGKLTMANQILTDSYKLLGDPVWLEPSACERIQQKAFFVRYPGVQRWHAWMKRELLGRGVLVTSTGFQRRVFGRKDSHDTLKEVLAHYPQYYTTYSIKLALLRQWQDAENRRPDGSLIVEPLLVVHDSKVIQFKQADLEFARRKDAEWFSNPIQVATTTLTIPASGTYGLNWKDQTFGL